MAKLYNAERVEINGVNLSDNVFSVDVNQSKPELDTTNMVSTGQERIAGLPNESLIVQLQQDFSAADVDATLFPLYDNNTAFPVKIRATNAAITATNPEYQATCMLLDYSPLSGDVGTLVTVNITFPVNGKITRATS